MTNIHSDTWCPLPFLSLTIHPTNKLTHCMMSEANMGSIVHDGWDNDRFQTLRQNMLDGKWSMKDNRLDDVNVNVSGVGDCGNCYYKEKRGLLSQRQNWLQNQIRMFPEGSFESANQLTNNKIRHLNLNLSNVCNFKCRMCSPSYSNALLPDFKWLRSVGGPHRSFNDNETKQIIDVDLILEKYGSQLSELQTIWVTGGEPFIDDRLVDFSNKLQNYCDTKKININITTNGSKIKLEQLEKLKHFGTLGINISIDSTGKLFEYMRSADVYTWDEMKNKIIEINQYREENKSDKEHRIELSYNGSFQTYNSYNTVDFFNFFIDLLKKTDWIEYRMLTGPYYLAVQHMPDHMKQKVRKNLLNLSQKIGDNKKHGSKFILNCIQSLETNRQQQYWDQFVKYTALLDVRRGQYLSDYAPEMWADFDDHTLTLFEKEYHDARQLS